MRLVIATNNNHKLVEIQGKLVDVCEVLNLAQIGCTDDIPEDGDTFEANALQKAEYIKDKYGYDCFADDCPETAQPFRS